MKTPYAILSHVWQDEEVSHVDLREHFEDAKHKLGFKKIRSCCDVAREEHRLKYVWIDTCCIDKRSSAELSEAINSMYRYYGEAQLCIIYLHDVEGLKLRRIQTIPAYTETEVLLEHLRQLRASKWFRRGWTLQELIAPHQRRFYTANWVELFSSNRVEHSRTLERVAQCAKIPVELLRHEVEPSSCCIAERMSWVSERRTTRPEDMAYCMMGLFDVQMPILYGEGLRHAFQRLQQEIIRTSFDHTIFTWLREAPNFEAPDFWNNSGLLANTPQEFASAALRKPTPSFVGTPCIMTNLGISLHVRLLGLPSRTAPVSYSRVKAAISPPMIVSCKAPFGTTESEELLESLSACVGILFAALQCEVPLSGRRYIPALIVRPVRGTPFYLSGVQCEAYRRVGPSVWAYMLPEDLKGAAYQEILVLQDEQYRQVSKRDTTALATAFSTSTKSPKRWKWLGK